MNGARDNVTSPSAWARVLGLFVDNRFVVTMAVAAVCVAGLQVSPFGEGQGPPRPSAVAVDAIPDIGENQQIVFTRWPGRSPRDVEDQVSYPLTTALLGIPGVRTVRSSSMLGFSTIYVIFDEDVEFYWSRSRLLEKLASLPAGTLPAGVSPTLGPDATALGQVFWYTLEGRNAQGEVVGGWDPHELRSAQDWQVRFALQSVPGVSEVASVGGHVREYQIDVNPEAMLAHGVRIEQVARAIAQSNLDVGARTLEINRVEYLVRGLGFVQRPEDLEEAVIETRGSTPLRVRDVARVSLGPAARRGLLDDAGAEVVGGVVVVRFGANPLEVIERVKEKISQIAPGLPRRVLSDGQQSQITIAPFYDRTTLIQQTLGTLSAALFQQVLITLLVVLVALRSVRTSLLISAVLPLAVLGTFLLMKAFGVDANVMALAGIAIAIGTIVDMGIVLVENCSRALREAPAGARRAHVVRDAAAEVAPAVMTSVATTVVSFVPVFALQASEGKLFRPVAYTKTFALCAALCTALVMLPAACQWLLGTPRLPALRWRRAAGMLQRSWVPVHRALLVVAVLALAYTLSDHWRPLGHGAGTVGNALFVGVMLGVLLGAFALFHRIYPWLLQRALAHKLWALAAPLLIVLFGLGAWLGAGRLLAWAPDSLRLGRVGVALAHALPGLGREYMPPFDEGSFLYMPSTMPHASIGEARDLLQRMDAAIAAIPEVERVVGKLGRVDSALDPAPVSMFETMVRYRPEWQVHADGTRTRQWRDHIRSPDDIWKEIESAAQAPGLTAAPRLMPISTRLVMLQSGMRAPLGIKVRGPDLRTIEAFGQRLERELKQVPGVRPQTVFADRVVGKPYLEVEIDRAAIARYGLTIQQVQDVIQLALAGKTLTHTVEGRERYAVRLRYMREERDSLQAMERMLVPAPGGKQIPLEQLAHIVYARGPQVIKAEDTFLTSYVLFDREVDHAEVDVVEAAQQALSAAIQSGRLTVPEGVSYAFAGSYENQLRSEERLTVLIPLALAVILVLLYLQFRSLSTVLILYSGVAVVVCGGFILMWLYGQPWFMDFELGGRSMRELFHMGPVNMSVAVWVGFIALIGIATDDGVLMATYLQQRFRAQPPTSSQAIRQAVRQAALRRLRPCLMTTATTLIALLPVVTATGRGADIMRPMALPALGGMTVELLTLFVVPVLYAAREEARLRMSRAGTQRPAPAGLGGPL